MKTTNGNSAFASLAVLTPVQVAVGKKELFVYHTSEDAVYRQIAGLFGIAAKRAYTKSAGKNETSVWAASRRCGRKPKTEAAEPVAA